MKFKILVVLLFCFTAVTAQKKQVTIHALDGKSYVVKRCGSQRGGVTFKYEGKFIVMVAKKIDKIEYRFKKEKKNYTVKYIKYSKEEKEEPMKQLVAGKVSLYVHTETLYNAVREFGSAPRSITNYYALKKGDTLATQITSNHIFENFKEDLTRYFSDCTDLVSKIENKEFRRRNIAEIVEYYNANCGTR